MAPDGSPPRRLLQTVKSCPAVLDVLNMGYIIPLWCDYKVKRIEKSQECPKVLYGVCPFFFFFFFPFNNMFGAATHTHEQMDAYPFPPDTFEGTFKLLNLGV